jgi:thiamine-phosphate diphosphorylase
MVSRFQYITSESKGFTYPQLAEEVCRGGCDWVQLRLKNMQKKDFYNIAIETQEVCKKFKSKLIINDNVFIAKKINADGVHIGKMDMHPAKAREILGNNFLIGCTANSFEEIIELSKFEIDYIGIGPFRYTSTKAVLDEILGIEGLKNIVDKCRDHAVNIPLIAIGGITIDDIEALKETGIYGIAVSSSVNNENNKQDLIKRILNKINITEDAKS